MELKFHWHCSAVLHYYFSNVNISSLFFFFQDQFVYEQEKGSVGGPLIMNAFEMITLSQGLNLSALFDRRQVQHEL